MIKQLKKRILNALKTAPSSAIYVNDICIYLGTEKHFDVDDRPSRGRDLEERVRRNRERSMSPPRYQQPSPQAFRGRSPPREQGGTGYYASPRRDRRYRSRSPLNQRRRTPSPYQLPAHAPGRQPDYRPRTPRYAENSNAVVFEASNRAENNRVENQAPRAAPGKFSPDLAAGHPDERMTTRNTVSDKIKQLSSLCRLLSRTSTSLTYSIPAPLAASFR